MVTLLAWMAQRLVSSKTPTKYASQASWRAITAEDWNRRSVLKSWAISRTNLWNGSFLRRSSVDFWYLLISRRATVPGRNLCGFLMAPPTTPVFLAALVANCFRGALPPVDFRAVCFVLAIFSSVWSFDEIFKFGEFIYYYFLWARPVLVRSWQGPFSLGGPEKGRGWWWEATCPKPN